MSATRRRLTRSFTDAQSGGGYRFFRGRPEGAGPRRDPRIFKSIPKYHTRAKRRRLPGPPAPTRGPYNPRTKQWPI